ncbi:DNA mismatch repair protein MutS [Pseudothauera nasutitermitis]|uniref:DNA mismatch repair protein MutS n=1 Tax=Pseudothauera nasutitermitis TaxID=2565930 RepID=A0A4S4B2A5_9RHOO|nr:Smr/MutS family protein [Pseudothauera nasutitermitis]THF65817.1 DNA mismatch repair protein MutS [Pseudothauera nasutitermitis]
MPRRRDRSSRRPPGADGGAASPFDALAELRAKPLNPLLRAWEAARAPRTASTATAPQAAEAAPKIPQITPADLALLHNAMADVRPLPARHARVESAAPRPAPEPLALKRRADEDATLHESLHTPLSFEDRLDIGEEAAFLRPGLPRRVLADLRRGRWVLQGEVDLHGLNREQAREELARFLHASLQRGRRCVRVIHGKGLGSPGRVPVLKQLSRGWLAQREEILAFCQAGPHAGGSGALLVLLRAPNGARDRG